MSYSNPKIPEGINYKQQHPAKEFFILIVGASSIIAGLIILLHLLAAGFAHHIPYAYEKKLAGAFEAYFENNYSLNSEQKPILDYFQSLSKRLAHCQTLPSDIHIKTYFIDDDTVNAMATLGGNIIIYRGLLEKLPNENTLAFVLSHEIAHIKLRHPIRAFSNSVLIGFMLGLLDYSQGTGTTGNMLNIAAFAKHLKFNRDQELAADHMALEGLMNCYGHATGAQTFFESFKQDDKNSMMKMDFISTHPNHESRIEAIQKNLIQNGWNTNIVQIQALPDFFKKPLNEP